MHIACASRHQAAWPTVAMSELVWCAQDPTTGAVRPKPSNETESRQEDVLESPVDLLEEAQPSSEATSTSTGQEQLTDNPQTDESRTGSKQKVVA